MAAILNFGSISKNTCTSHVARNVMLKFEKKMTKQIFWVFKTPKN